jgi:hypothetical protein
LEGLDTVVRDVKVNDRVFIEQAGVPAKDEKQGSQISGPPGFTATAAVEQVDSNQCCRHLAHRERCAPLPDKGRQKVRTVLSIGKSFAQPGQLLIRQVSPVGESFETHHGELLERTLAIVRTE